VNRKYSFKVQQEWDERKSKLCAANNFTLIRIKYTDKLTVDNVRNRIEEWRPNLETKEQRQ